MLAGARVCVAGEARFVPPTVLVGLGVAGRHGGVVRGLLGARRRTAWLAAALSAENLVRCLAAAMLVALDVDDPYAYGVALVLGYAACAAWPSAWRARPSARRAPPAARRRPARSSAVRPALR